MEHNLRMFEERQIKDAWTWAAKGNQALHRMRAKPWPHIPKCFRDAKWWGHLFDTNTERLIRTAKELGVKRVRIHQKGTPKQHVDLYGRPLEHAIKKATINHEEVYDEVM